MIMIGSIMFIITRSAIVSSFSYVSATFCSAPGTSPVSSPILIKSIINCGKIAPRASGCASVFPSVTASRVAAIASFKITFGTTCSVIFNAVNTGTPLCSSVPSVRANCPNKFNRTTRPTTGVFIFQLSIFRRPSGVARNRMNNIVPVKNKIPNTT